MFLITDSKVKHLNDKNKFIFDYFYKRFKPTNINHNHLISIGESKER